MTTYRIRESGALLTERELRERHENVSLPAVLDAATLDAIGADPVLEAPAPEVGEHQSAVRSGCVQDALGNWVQAWGVRDWSEDEIAAAAESSRAALLAAVTAAVQARLDNFAKTRGYDGVLSAATYATSTVDKFRAEGQYCVNARDAHWAACYDLMARVQAGERAMPTVAQVLAAMPALEWPQ